MEKLLTLLTCLLIIGCGEKKELNDGTKTAQDTGSVQDASKRSEDSTKKPMGSEAKEELLAAVKKGDLAVVKQSLAKGADVNTKLSLFDETALHLAASEGHEEIVELLIAAGADVNRQSSFPTNDGSRRTPLDDARSQMYGGGNATPPPNLSKDHEHHKFQAIADLLKENGGHSSSIFVAVKTGDVVGVKALLNGKVDFTKTSSDGRTPLHLAAEYGHKEIASLFLRKGAQADSGNWSDKTALHYAAEKGHIEIIELLLSMGANVNSLGGAPTGTPLDFATHFERTKAAAFLREKKAKTGEELKIEEK